MATYTMTPAERRARARAIVESRRNNTLYNLYKQRQPTSVNYNDTEVKEKKEENDNIISRGLETVGDLFGNVVSGAVKGVEGIVDFGAGIVGGVGGIFSDSFQDDVQDFIEKDYTSKFVSNPLNELFDDSYIKDGGIIEGVASGIGQMLPAVAVTLATAGAGAPAAVAQAASLATTSISAAGNATESAYKDGAGYYKGLGYGIASGAVEAGTEKLFGGATKNLFGKGALDNVGKEIADTGIKKVVKGALEEGAEEIVAEIANPALKSIYKGKGALSEYGSGDYWKGVGEAGIVGSLTGLAYSGTVGYGVSKMTGQHTGKAADINDSLIAIENQKKKKDKLWSDGHDSAVNDTRIAENVKGNYKNIETVLKKANDSKRAELIKEFSLEEAFEADGSMKADFAASLELSNQSEQITSLDKRYVSPDLQDKSQKVAETLTSTTEDLRRKYMEENKVSYEQAAEAVKEVKAFKGDMTDNAKKSYSKLKKGLNYLNTLSGKRVKLVVTEAHDSFNGSLLDDTIYIGADTFESDTWAETLVHEYTHFAEGTKEYQELIDVLTGDSKLVEKTLSDIFEKAGYGFDKEKTRKLLNRHEKLQNSKNKTANIDSNEEIRYNRSKIARYISYEKVGEEAVRNIRSQLKKVYDNKDGIINGVAIESGNEVYVVDSGRENGYITFGIRRKKKISDARLRADFIRSTNNDAISKGYISDELSSRIGDGLSSDSGRNMRRESGAELQTDSRESQNNQSRIFGEDANNRGLNTTADNEVLEELTEDELKYIRLYKSELGAHLSANMLGTESFIDKLVRENTTVAEKILNKLSDLKQMFERLGDAEARAEYKKIKKAEKLYLSAVEKAGYAYVGRKIVGAIDERDEISEPKYLFAGNKAKTADKLKLATAEKMLKDGKDSETVRKETGWFKGYDGKWRFEIDDSQMTFSKNGFNPDVLEYKELEFKFIIGTITEQEHARFNELSDIVKGINLHRLDQFVKHDALFEAYPELKSIEVIFKELDGNEKGSYDYRQNEIQISNKLSQNEIKKTLIHEIQHAVQHVEDFSLGSNPGMFNNSEEFSAYEHYERTAGEIEARDVSTRLDYDSDKRKNTRPDIDRTDVVFADGAKENYNLDEKLGEQLYDWLNNRGQKGNKYNGIYFSLGTTPDILVKHGAKKDNMIMYTEVVEKVTGMKGDSAHIISLDEIAKLPSQLNDPILLFKGSVPASFIALTEIVDKQGHDVVVAVHINKKYNRSAITKIASLYSKTNDYGDNKIISYVNNQIKSGNLLDASAKKAPMWFTTKGLQLPKVVQTIIDANGAEREMQKGESKRSLTNATSSASINSIPENSEKSNSFDKKTSKTSNEPQFNLKSNGKITKSRGEYQKLKADYTKEKKYDKKDVSKYILDVPYVSTLPKATQNDIIESMWYTLNTIESDNQKERFTDTCYNRILRDLWQESNSFAELSTDEIREIEEKLYKTIRNIVKTGGSPSFLSKVEAQYAKTESGRWRKKYQDSVKWNELIGKLMSRAKKMDSIKHGVYLNATQYKQDLFKGSIEKLSRVEFRGNLNVTGTRNIIKDLREWYDSENPIFKAPEGSNKKTTEFYDEYIADILDGLANGTGGFSNQELSALNDVMDYFIHFIEHYNKVKRNGEYVDATPIAEDFIKIIRRNKTTKKVGWFRNFINKYMTLFCDNETVVKYMDGYDDGFYTTTFNNLREACIEAEVKINKFSEPLKDFYKENKKFIKEMETRTVKYQGHEIPLSQAMLFYMTLNREQAQMGLAKSGFSYVDKKTGNTVHLEGFALEETYSLKEIKDEVNRVKSKLSEQFTDLDKQYIALAEKIFNEDCKKLKKKADIERKGYSNVLEGYYVPIRRGTIAHSVDSSIWAEVDRTSKASFNQETVKGAKSELSIEPLDVVLHRHIKGIALYSSLAAYIDEYNLIFNLDVGGNANKPISVKVESENSWSDGDKFFRRLISDIQGIPSESSLDFPILSKIRSAYAKYQLGANPKVWLTQTSSLLSASSILDIDCIIKGFGVSGKNVDEYCALAKLRNDENTAAMAQGVMDKIDKVGDWLMKPIGKVDRLVVTRLFGACQVQIEKNDGLKVGTEENKKRAGELLKEVIIKTQQNSLATERSAAMRSGNEILKASTMFSADSMKVMGRVIDSYGELLHLKEKRKKATDPAEIGELDKKINLAKKNARKSTSALISSAVLMALIAQFFRFLYNKDEEPKEEIKNTAFDAAGNLIGGLPILRDVYSKLADGYDVDNYAYAAFNDLLESVDAVRDTSASIIQGKHDSRDIASTLRKVMYSAGQVLGIPTRNLYNVVTGLTRRVSPSSAYWIDDKFYKKSYSSDLAKAIERDDEDMIAMIAGLMLNENIGGIDDSSARKSLNELILAGYDVLPRSTPEKITYEDEEITLSARERKTFKNIYSTANEALASLVKLSQYASATDEVKSKSVKFIYDVYYNLAVQDALGIELEYKNVLFAEAIDIEKLALIISTAKSLTADIDKNGVTITGSRKTKVQAYVNSLNLTAAQKYMIMGYLGYKNVKGEEKVRAYIKRLNLSAEEKQRLLEYSGYAA